jgi:hypothetical protein
MSLKRKLDCLENESEVLFGETTLNQDLYLPFSACASANWALSEVLEMTATRGT